VFKLIESLASQMSSCMVEIGIARVTIESAAAGTSRAMTYVRFVELNDGVVLEHEPRSSPRSNAPLATSIEESRQSR